VFTALSANEPTTAAAIAADKKVCFFTLVSSENFNSHWMSVLPEAFVTLSLAEILLLTLINPGLGG
jgi:hypothetical protein